MISSISCCGQHYVIIQNGEDFAMVNKNFNPIWVWSVKQDTRIPTVVAGQPPQAGSGESAP